MKKIKLILLATMLFISNNLFSQTKREPLNNITFGTFGEASIISLGWSKDYFLNNNVVFNIKTGIGYNESFCINCQSKDISWVTFPSSASIAIGFRTQFLELGMGATPMYTFNSLDDNGYIVYPILGWRFIPKNSGGANFRLFTHIISSPERELFIYKSNDKMNFLFVPIGFSFGYSF